MRRNLVRILIATFFALFEVACVVFFALGIAFVVILLKGGRIIGG